MRALIGVVDDGLGKLSPQAKTDERPSFQWPNIPSNSLVYPFGF